MIQKGKKIIITLFLLLLGLGVLKTVRAASSYESYHSSTKEGKITREKLDQHTFNDTIFAALEVVGGRSNPETGEPEGSGALQFTTKLIATLYAAPPASGFYYAYDVLHRLGVSPAYAQGVGFTGLQPILPIWKAFRNVTYILFTIIFIGIGLAIMFRVKISPQAVITIENALPKIIGALILVTFSYAIAGFMIDLMYVTMFLIYKLLENYANFPQNVMNTLATNFTFGDLAGSMMAPVSYGWDDFVKMFYSGNLGIITATVGAAIGAALGTLVNPGAGTVVGLFLGAAGGGGVGGSLVTLILYIVVFFAIISLLFKLIKTYISIILGIIFSPLQIALGVLPLTNTSGFSKWLKSLLANLLVFPALELMVIIAKYLTRINTDPAFGSQPLWVPPFLGNWGTAVSVSYTHLTLPTKA